MKGLKENTMKEQMKNPNMEMKTKYKKKKKEPPELKYTT